MNKQFGFLSMLIACGLLLSCATTNTSQSPPQTYPLNAAVQLLTNNLLVSIGERQTGKITVADLIGPEDTITGLGEYISEKISVRLFGTGKFPNFMERRQLKQVLANIKMENSGYFNQETASKFGKMIGVDSMVRVDSIIDGYKAKLNDGLVLKITDALRAIRFDWVF